MMVLDIDKDWDTEHKDLVGVGSMPELPVESNEDHIRIQGRRLTQRRGVLHKAQ